MGKIQDAIKKINTDIQKRPQDEVFAKLGEYVIDHIATDAAAEIILAENKSLEKIFDEIRQDAYKEALTRKGSQDCVAIASDGQAALDRVMRYFGLSADALQESAKPSFARLSLDDF